MGIESTDLTVENFDGYFLTLCNVQGWDYDLLRNAIDWYADKKVENALRDARDKIIRDYKAWLAYCEACLHHGVYLACESIGKKDDVALASRICRVAKDNDLLDNWFEVPSVVFINQYGSGELLTEVFRLAQVKIIEEGAGKQQFDYMLARDNGDTWYHYRIDANEEYREQLVTNPWASDHATIESILLKTAEDHGKPLGWATRAANAISRNGDMRNRWTKASAEELMYLRNFGNRCLELVVCAQADILAGKFDYLKELCCCENA